MSLFNFESLMRLVVLLICTTTYIRRKFPTAISKKDGWQFLLYKFAVIGTRLSPFVGMLCLFFGTKRLINIFV